MAVANVQRTVYASATNVTTHTINWGTTPTVGNLLVVCFGGDAAYWPTNGTWTAIVEYAPLGSTVAFYRVAGASEGSVTVESRDALSGGGSLVADSMAGFIGEYSGAAASSPVEASVVTNTGSTSAVSTGSTATTSQADELAIAAFSIPSPGGGISAGSWTNSFVETMDSQSAGSPSSYMAAAEKVLSATGAQSTAATLSATPNFAWASVLFTIKAASTAQILLPSSTVTAGGWTATGAASLHAALSDASDTTYAGGTAA